MDVAIHSLYSDFSSANTTKLLYFYCIFVTFWFSNQYGVSKMGGFLCQKFLVSNTILESCDIEPVDSEDKQI